ncbi:hypothetical protein EDF56_1011128 [Novosphingobium sp. PhB165]|uniref:GFA family protein n=1 Tax=Novosphingobium sp. PhB165 TaxID=2485105 RepID=UPI00104D877B|nr:GFA family protein [Novosphingobium sp. PhB165]TCM22438.1 hypothetical protein EDF56_1011128 [Novosphingobium sp. PhB165]
MTVRMTGGCQCGRIRYTAEVDPETAYLCHCKMCRRATGGVSTAFVNPLRDKVVWHTEPDWYQSSPIARRPFCSQCGTPLGFEFSEGATNIDLTVGSFDDPTPFRPEHNYATESMLPAWADVTHLPGYTSAENPNVIERWKAAGMAPPE